MASIINASSSGSGGIVQTADASGVLQLQSNGTTAITVDTSQNVGIGTSSGTRKLNVYGGASGTRTMTVTSNAPEGLEVGVNASNIAAVNSAAGGAIIFTQADTERMRIDSSGNLLVGTASYLNSNASHTFVNTNSSYPTAYFYNNTNANVATLRIQRYQSDGDAITFFYGTTQKGYISVTSTGTTYGTLSDYRLKENIKPMAGALEKVAALKPATYDWKGIGKTGQGFIAHELQEVVPECVTGEKDAVDAEGKPVYQGIDVSFLVATLTAAIQEQQALIVQLQADVAALKGA
jgi:hypothetical protein